jgi:hypothetical protein
VGALPEPQRGDCGGAVPRVAPAAPQSRPLPARRRDRGVVVPRVAPAAPQSRLRADSCARTSAGFLGGSTRVGRTVAHGHQPGSWGVWGARPPRRYRDQRRADRRSASSVARSPDRIRTGATALRGRRARPLHNGAITTNVADESLPHQPAQLPSAGVPGLEPRLTEPESVGLPITPYPTSSRPRSQAAHRG